MSAGNVFHNLVSGKEDECVMGDWDGRHAGVKVQARCIEGGCDWSVHVRGGHTMAE